MIPEIHLEYCEHNLETCTISSSVPAHFRGIDGLRALAILGVIALHTCPSLLQGGFIGVTMFFVITGFLATRSVLKMVDRTGSFGYSRYLIRRITRLWPVMLATIAVVPWLTWMFAPSLLQKVVSDSLPSALFASNWVYIFRKVPYFEAAGLPSPSDPSVVLGRDDAVLSGLAVADGGARQNHQVQMGALHGDSCIMAASTADMVLLFDPANTSRVYYGTDTRLAELAAGALLAIWIAPSSRGTEAAEAERLRKQCRSNVRPATKRRPSHYRLQCSWHRGFGGTADRILVRQRVSVVHVPRRVPDYRVHIVVRLGLLP